MDESEDTQLTIVGNLWGLHTQCSNKCLKFNITSGYSIVDGYIPIEGVQSFPSLSPFLEYKIIVERKGTYFRLLRILEINPKEILTQNLIVYYTETEKNKRIKTDEIIAKEDKPIEKLSKKPIELYSHLKSLSGRIKEESDLGKIAVSFKNRIWPIIQAALQPKIFYELLRYFHELFLYNFTETELGILKEIMMSRPDYFCFRDWIQSYLTNKKIIISLKERMSSICNYSANPNMKRLLEGTKCITIFESSYKDKFYCSLNYANGINEDNSKKKDSNYVSNGIRLITRNHTLFYDYRYFPLSIDLLQFACEDYGNKSIPIDDVKCALELYLLCEDWRNKFGRTCFKYASLKKNTESLSKGLKYLMDNKLVIGVNPLTMNQVSVDYFRDEDYITLPSDILKEIELCELLTLKIKDIKIYYSPSGRSDSLLHIQKRFTNTGTLILSNGPNISSIISKKTGLRVQSFSVDHQKYPIDKKITNIVLLNSNKLSIDDILLVLRNCHPNTTLHFVGDKNEYSVHPKKGFGEIFRSFYNTIPLTEEFEITGNTKIIRAHKKLLNDGTIDDLDIKFCNTLEESIEKITAMKTSKEEKQYIFCSNESDKKSLMEGLFATKSKLFSTTHFSCGDDIVIHKTNNIATIKNAKLFGTNGVLIPIAHKHNIFLEKGIFQLEIESCIDGSSSIINTSMNNISHASVLTVREMSTIQIKKAILYLGEKSKFRDILNVIKYCEDEIIIVSSYSNYMKALKQTEYEHITDLESKIRMVWFK